MQRKYLFFLFISLIQEYSYSQTYTNQSLQKTYWDYRDRFRKHFTLIGSGFGQSIPFENIQPETLFDVKPLNFDATLRPKIKGRLTFGDANFNHGWYLAVLATEYRLSELRITSGS